MGPESPVRAPFTAGATWAPRVQEIDKTHTKARNRLTDFKTRKIIRSSSAINLDDKWTYLPASTNTCSERQDSS
ncbi:MAG: hypothetical protein WCA89_06645, partial [Terracidiphilus sp.]